MRGSILYLHDVEILVHALSLCSPGGYALGGNIIIMVHTYLKWFDSVAL